MSPSYSTPTGVATDHSKSSLHNTVSKLSATHSYFYYFPYYCCFYFYFCSSPTSYFSPPFHRRAAASDQKAYIVAVGLGLGVWGVSPHQARIMLEVLSLAVSCCLLLPLATCYHFLRLMTTIHPQLSYLLLVLLPLRQYDYIYYYTISTMSTASTPSSTTSRRLLPVLIFTHTTSPTYPSTLPLHTAHSILGLRQPSNAVALATRGRHQLQLVPPQAN